jgi:hypothetical protein
MEAPRGTGDGPSGAGAVRVGLKKASIEAISRARLAHARRVLEEAAPGAVRLAREKVERLETAMKRHTRTRSAPPEPLPRELTIPLLQQTLERHYLTWPDIPVPALDGVKPRAAARDPRLRPRLEGLLKDLERIEAQRRRDEGYGYDVDRLRRELGL